MSDRPDTSLSPGNLVLYKSHPARVLKTGSKIEISLFNGKVVRVRPKDIVFLHTGPFGPFQELEDCRGEVEEACDILAGETVTLADCAELIYGDYSPASAWAVCLLLQDGLYLRGTPHEITVRTRAEIAAEQKARIEKSRAKEEYLALLERIKSGALQPHDSPHLKEVEEFALGKGGSSRIMRDLDFSTPQQAHALLIRLKVWNEMVNPYPARLGFSQKVSYPPVPDLPREDRLDLTHLPAYAIDDEGNQDPDDAISIEGDTLWVHIADVAALAEPDSALDLAARSRATTLYLPEGPVTMLPSRVSTLLGLGMQEISPALSFGITLKDNGAMDTMRIQPSLVRVTRLSYGQAEQLLDTTPFSVLVAHTQRYHRHRRQNGAVELHFPEVRISVDKGIVHIKPLSAMGSRALVTNAMLMAGEAAARFAITHNIPFPFSTQPPLESVEHPEDLAAMYSYRKQMKPSSVNCSPGKHAGLGLEAYSRATSPLRRYLDLVAHQQLRRFVTGGPLMDEETLLHRAGAFSEMARGAQKLERLSNQHWTLLYLMQNPNWQGAGQVAEVRDRYGIVSIPELAMETRLSAARQFTPNTELLLKIMRVDLPELNAYFSLVD